MTVNWRKYIEEYAWKAEARRFLQACARIDDAINAADVAASDMADRLSSQYARNDVQRARGLLEEASGKVARAASKIADASSYAE